MSDKGRFVWLQVVLLVSVIVAGIVCFLGYLLLLNVWETVKSIEDLRSNGGLIILCAIPGIVLSLVGIWLLHTAKTAFLKAQQLSANYEITALKAELDKIMKKAELTAELDNIMKKADLTAKLDNIMTKADLTAKLDNIMTKADLTAMEKTLEQIITDSKQDLNITDSLTQQLMIIEKISNSDEKDTLYASLVQTLSSNPAEQSTPPAP